MIRAAALLLLAASAAYAQSWDGDQGPMTLPSTVDARTSELSAGLLAKTPVERIKPQVARDPSGTTITVEQVKKGGGENTLWEMRWEPAEPWGPGTWVAFRDGLGRLRELRIILLEGSDAVDNKLAQSGTWVRLVPQGRSSRLDLFVAGRLVTGGWTVPGSLLDVMASSDTWVWEATPDVDWGSVLPQRRWEDEKVEAVRTAMRKALSTVPLAAETLWLSDPRANSDGTATTGAPWGQWLTLAGSDASRGLGPWGVTLWTADGVLRGWKTAPMTWKALQRPRIVLPGYSEAFVPDPGQDPAFAVNWIRNLGLAVEQTLHPSRALTDTSADVKDLPFVAPADASGAYDVDDVPALFHLLAVTRPGQIYLMSLSVQSAQNGLSAAVSYLEPAVLLPWIGKDNRVRAAVYAGPREETWDQWLADFPATAAGARGNHLLLTALPLPAQTPLPRLPLR